MSRSRTIFCFHSLRRRTTGIGLKASKQVPERQARPSCSRCWRDREASYRFGRERRRADRPKTVFLHTPICALRWRMTHPFPHPPAAPASQPASWPASWPASGASPAPAAPPRRNADYRWTPAKAMAFLEALAQCGKVAAAARGVGMTRQSAYRLRARSALVAQAWPLALAAGRARRELRGRGRGAAFQGHPTQGYGTQGYTPQGDGTQGYVSQGYTAGAPR